MIVRRNYRVSLRHIFLSRDRRGENVDEDAARLLEEIENLAIVRRGSTQIRIRDVASVQRTHAEREVITPAVTGLENRLGAIVFQFPPLGPAWIRHAGGPSAFAARLHDFLSSLPIGPEYAVEIRDRSLLSSAYSNALRDSGTSHCFAVHPSMPDVLSQSQAIDQEAQRITLVRWMLNPHVGLSYNDAKARYEPFNRLVGAGALTREAIFKLLRQRGATPGYVIVNNKAEGSAPLSIRHLAAGLAGQREG